MDRRLSELLKLLSKTVALTVGLIAVAVLGGYLAMMAVIGLANGLLPDTVREGPPALLAYLAWGGTTLVILVVEWMWVLESRIGPALQRYQQGQAHGDDGDGDGGLDPGRAAAVPATHPAQDPAVADRGQQGDQRRDVGQVVEGQQSQPAALNGPMHPAVSGVRSRQRRSPLGKKDVLDPKKRHDQRKQRRKASDQVILPKPGQRAEQAKTDEES